MSKQVKQFLDDPPTAEGIPTSTDRGLGTRKLQSIPAKRELDNIPQSFLAEILVDIEAGDLHTAKKAIRGDRERAGRG